MTFLFAMMFALLAHQAHAVSPVIWTQNTHDAFAEGEAAAVTITRDGEVQLGPTLETVGDTGEEFVWSLAEAGGRVYAGTGNEGRVYRVANGSAELLFDSPERAIFSVAATGDGTVYAGSSPGGLIYRISARGEAKTFARTGDEHVWALIPDGKGGLFAATGGRQGRVIRVSSDGTVKTLATVTDPNVTVLVRGADGTLYAGTDQNGLVYRVTASGNVDVLYDAGETEIKTLLLQGDGRLLAGAMSSAGPQGARPPQGGNGKRPQGGSGARSVVYAIQPSGSAWRLWDVPAPSVQALAGLPDGDVLVVAGNGKLYALHPDASVSTVVTLSSDKPWAFLGDDSAGGWMASSGSGVIQKLSRTRATKGSLTSPVEDFGLVTRWGRLGWDGDSPSGTDVTFDVRAGNSEIPDATWTDWTAVATDGAISVRAARYLQYRANLSGAAATPIIRRVRVSGLPENIQPLVVDLGVRGPHEQQGHGESDGKQGGRRRGPQAAEQSDGWTIAWTTADVNNDDLNHAIHFKGRDETTWKLLAEDVSGNQYVWDTESAPEGVVQVRVTVSDAPSNPPAMAKTASRVSAPFTIDHTEPVVTVSSVEGRSGGATVVGVFKDATSPVQSAAYSLNSGDWRVMFPGDDVFDSGEEPFRLDLRDLKAGEYTLVIRATDSHGNVGVAKRVFTAR